MDPKLQTSFIPKKSLIQTTKPKPARTTNLVTLISTIIFVTVLVLAGAAWGYKNYLTKTNKNLESQLNDLLSKFEPELVTILSREDARIESSKILLNQHVALTSLFEHISNITLKTVRFDSFTYGVDSKDPTKVTISMTGEAQSFSAVALQADVFRQEVNTNYIKNPLFSGLDLDEAGNVKFNFTGTLDPSKISYRSYINALQVAADGEQITP